MRKIFGMFFLLLSCGILLSQEQEKNNYFPLAVGNKWEYIESFAYSQRLVMTITKDTVMNNGKKYYIFEYSEVMDTNFYISNTKYYFTPLDPVRMDENGDIYGYDTLTQNEYLYLPFSKDSVYQPYGTCDDFLITLYKIFDTPTPRWWLGSREWMRSSFSSTNFGNCGWFFFINNVGMVVLDDHYNIADCWQIYPWDPPCPPFFSQFYILVYAIINGEKVYSIENIAEYLNYMNTVDINPSPTRPQEIKLHQNYPNPFNPETRIDFEIPKTEKVKLVIYNTLGKKVKTLLDDELQAGKYSTTWNGKDDMNNKVSSGIYFYQLTFGNTAQSITKKLIILK